MVFFYFTLFLYCGLLVCIYVEKTAAGEIDTEVLTLIQLLDKDDVRETENNLTDISNNIGSALFGNFSLTDYNTSDSFMINKNALSVFQKLEQINADIRNMISEFKYCYLNQKSILYPLLFSRSIQAELMLRKYRMFFEDSTNARFLLSLCKRKDPLSLTNAMDSFFEAGIVSNEIDCNANNTEKIVDIHKIFTGFLKQMLVMLSFCECLVSDRSTDEQFSVERTISESVVSTYYSLLQNFLSSHNLI